MKNQAGKRIKKEVYVYERGIYLYTTLGNLREDQVAADELSINWEKTEQMRMVMDTLTKEAIKELAPSGITNLGTLYYLNYKIKEIFSEIENQFDFNNSFYGRNGEYTKAVIQIHKRILDEIISKRDKREIISKNKEAFYF